MRRLTLVVVLMLSLCATVHAAENQAFLGIFAETSLMKMPGMPAMPDMPDMTNAPKVPGMPDMSQFMSMGKPQRSLNVRLWSPGIAAEGASAYITPPDGLKQGKKLDLEFYRPKPESSTGSDGGSADTAGSAETSKFTIKMYWGSSEEVRPGQPKISAMGNLTPEQKGRMEQEMKKARKTQKGDSYFYKPDWTTAYWPTKKQPGKIAKDASLEGNFSLTTSYTGNIAIDAPATVDFLAPIEMSSPDLEKSVSLDSFIPFKWPAIPNALGFHAQIIGMQGKDTIIMWSSSEKEPEMAMDWDYLEMATVLEYVKSEIMMKGTATSVTVPRAIFKDCDMTMFRMIGYGTGIALPEGQPLPRVQTKTTLSITPLGGKMAKGMGMPGAGGDGEVPTELPEMPE